MEDNEGTGMNEFKSSVTGFNVRDISSTNDDLSERRPLAIESSFSYITNSEKAKKSRKIAGSPKQHEKWPRSSKSGIRISVPQRVNGTVNNQSKTSLAAEGKIDNSFNKDKKDLNTNLCLTGRRLPLCPEFWTSDNSFRSRSDSEPVFKNIESNDRNPGLQTYPPTNVRFSYANEVSSRQSHISGNFVQANRHRLPAFRPRPLGQSWVGVPEQQKSREESYKRSLDDVRAYGVSQPQYRRQRSPPRRNNLAPRLKRISSQDSLKGHIPRTRSLSLPVPSKLHESHVMEWKEKRTGGVTYVTPVLHTSSEGDLNTNFHNEDEVVVTTEDTKDKP